MTPDLAVLRAMTVEALLLLNDTSVAAGQFYARLQRLDVCATTAARFIRASERGEQMKGQYEDLQVGRELRAALDNAKASLTLLQRGDL